MKLVLFFTYGVSLKAWDTAGILYREVRLYRELRKLSVEVVFVTYGDVSDRIFQSSLDGIKIIPIYERISAAKSPYLRLFQTLSIPFVLREELQDADIIKTNQMWGSWVATIAALFFRKKMIARVGYEAYRNLLNRKSSFLARLTLFILSWITYRFSHRVIVTTLPIADFVVENFGVARHTINIFPNWVDTSAFSPSPHQAEKNGIQVLFVGRLSEEKNVSLLIEALVGTNLHLTIAGDGPLRDELELQAHNMSVDVTFLGVIEHKRLPDLYRNCKAYVLCSRYEGNPKSLIEAMSCACGVIGTNVPGIVDLISDQSTGLIVHQNPISLRNAIVELVKNPMLRMSLGAEARERILKSNTFRSYLKNELTVFDACLGNDNLKSKFDL